MRPDRRRMLAGPGLAGLGLAGLALAGGLAGCATPAEPRAAGPGGPGATAGGPAAGSAGPSPAASSAAASSSAPSSMAPNPQATPQALEEVPYVQTPNAIVDAMLDLAEVRRGDVLLDLGSGDGRVVIRAATRFRVPGLGVEIDPALVEVSREGARRAAVSDLARFETQDLFETDLSKATVITLYLLPDVNLALRPRLLALAPGTRIVSHDWDMADWLPDRSLVLPAPGKPVGLRKESQMHRWTVPAAIAGVWIGRVAGTAGGAESELEIRIVQQFQRIGLHWRSTSDAGRGRSVLATGDARLAGTGARIALQGTEGALSVALQARGDRLEGTLQAAAGERTWWARRVR